MAGADLEWVLASASPRRRDLLARLGHSFRCEVADIEEWEPDEASPVEQVEHNALSKARAVAARFPQQLVIGSDTTVALGNRLLAKPKDLADATRMLRMLSGRTHQVFTGVALILGGREHVFHESSDVCFKELNAEDIARYLSSVEVLDKAGAYAVQEGGEIILAGFTGSFENIMGLPVQRLATEIPGFLNGHAVADGSSV